MTNPLEKCEANARAPFALDLISGKSRLFLRSILLLTSLIWITESDWCPARFPNLSVVIASEWPRTRRDFEAKSVVEQRHSWLPAGESGGQCVSFTSAHSCRRKEVSRELQLQVCVLCVLCATVCGSQSTMPQGLLARGQGDSIDVRAFSRAPSAPPSSTVLRF